MKRYVCVDIEMSEFTKAEKKLVHGIRREVIQIGAVMLDENYNMISEFSTFVKPAFSHITETIQELTGISQENVDKADDFITAFDKYCYWVGDCNDIVTFCWSDMDYVQLWNELHVKAKHRTDLLEYLESFIDLQKTFCNLIDAKQSVSLDAAVTLVKSEFEGQHHTALSDAYNTGCILHKLCCCDGLEPEFDFLNMAVRQEEAENKSKKDKEYQNSFAAFMSPELLEMFGYVSAGEGDSSDCDDNYFYDYNDKKGEKREVIDSDKPLTPEESICIKYNIPSESFNSFAEKIKLTDNMKIVA